MESVCTTATASKVFSFLLSVSVVLNCFSQLPCDAQLLPQDEVEALTTISEKRNLNISRSFCSGGRVENVTFGSTILTDFICNCNGTVCRVTNILLKGQNLTGILPSEFANLTQLQQIDLSRNYFSGPIPTAFAQLPLTNLSLLGNRINGSIPKEIGDIGTLLELVLEDNQLGGELPSNLGSLSNLSRLIHSKVLHYIAMLSLPKFPSVTCFHTGYD